MKNFRKALVFALSPVPLWIGAANGTTWLVVVGALIAVVGVVVFFVPLMKDAA